MRARCPVHFVNGRCYALVKMTPKEIKQFGVIVLPGSPPYRLGIPQWKSDKVLVYPRPTGATECYDIPPRD